MREIMVNVAAENVAISLVEGDVPSLDCHAIEGIFGGAWLVDVRVGDKDKHPCVGEVVFTSFYMMDHSGRAQMAYDMGRIGVGMHERAMYDGSCTDVEDFINNIYMHEDYIKQIA